MATIARRFGTTLVLGSGFIIAVTLLPSEFWIPFLQSFSPDGDIESPSYVRLRLREIFSLVMLGGVWIWINSNSFQYRRIQCIWNRRCALNLCALILSYSFYLHMRGIVDFPLLFGKEALLEMSGALLFLGCAGFLIYALYRSRKYRRPPTGFYEQTMGMCVAIGCFFVGMEEISWGQTYLGFAGPHWLTAANAQHETNVHNLLESSNLTSIETMIFSLLPVIVLVASVVGRHSKRPLVRIYAPDSSQIFLAAIVAVGNLSVHDELAEFLFALLVTVYIATVYRRRLQYN